MTLDRLAGLRERLRNRLAPAGRASPAPASDLAPLAGDSTRTVTRLIRVSRAQLQRPPMVELFAARERVNGAPIPGLCGAVLHVSGWFVLWQEGPQAALDQALRRSAHQHQHDEPRVLHLSTGPATLREPLALTTTQWIESPQAFAARIAALARVAGSLEPNDVWRSLSEPSRLGGSDPVLPADLHVGVLASDDQRSIDWARRLAELFRRPVVYRRFAGARSGSSDVGAAYFDLAIKGRRLRVHALSRRALGKTLVHQSLGTPDRLTLLLGTEGRNALDLATRVADFLQPACVRPSIDLVADCPLVGAGIGDFLRGRLDTAVRSRDSQLSEQQLMALLLGTGPSEAVPAWS